MLRFQDNRCLGTEDNVARVATNQQQPVEWKVTKTRDTTTEHVTAKLETDVRILSKTRRKKIKQRKRSF